MDILSEVLKAVTLKGAVFYNAEFSSPWSVRSPASQTIAPHFGPGAGHVIIYHLLTEGRAGPNSKTAPKSNSAPATS